MNKIVLILISFVLSGSLSFAENTQPYFQIKSNAKAPESVLYIQSSNQANLKLIDKKTHRYELILSNINPMVSYFSDRPERITGQIGNAVYLDTWNQGGKKDFNSIAPNAVVSGVTKINGLNKSMNIVMELSNPILDTSRATLSYKVKILSSSEDETILERVTLHYTTLFIDGGVCTTCIIGG